MRVYRRNGHRVEDVVELATIDSPQAVHIEDVAGNRWRIRDARYGNGGLEIGLAEAADGTQAMHLEPEASNSVTVRPRGTQ